MLSKSLTGEEVARELISVLSITYGIRSNHLLAAMRDRASTNNIVMQTLKIAYPSIVDIGCFSHTIDHVGSCFDTPTLSDFITLWISLFVRRPDYCGSQGRGAICLATVQQDGGASGRLSST